MACIERYASAGHKPFQEMQGIFAWELLVSIPFDLIGVNPESLPEKLYANFYKCADNSSLPHYLSWSPIETENPDFHRPEFFGEIYFR
ncbi:MAG: carbohydrate-binding family 9-like protein [Coprobacter fastidiosus]